MELNKRLQQTERERDLLEKKLAKAQVSSSSVLKVVLGFVLSCSSERNVIHGERI